MPELPAVEHGRRIAERTLLGRQLTAVAAARDTLVYDGTTALRFARALKGRHVQAIERRGKFIWFALDARPWPVMHFGMTGAFVVYDSPADRPRFWKFELCTDAGKRLAMINPRRFGRIRLRRAPLHEPPIAGLGFDPLLAMPAPAAFARQWSKRKGNVKAVLLDQAFVAGVGNWIADEVLYQARIRPHRRANDLSNEEVQRVRQCLGRVVRQAVAVDNDKTRFPQTWLFHHRWGKNSDARTARGESILHQTIAGRTTAWVPDRQQ